MILDKVDITTTKVADLFKSDSRDVGTLCTHPDINPWSKCKPVNLSDPDPDRTKPWWKGDNKRCGFNIGILEENGAVHRPTKIDDLPLADWHYDFVTKANPKRLADFGGYDSEAKPIIATGIDKDEIYINKSKGPTHTFYFDITYQGDDTTFGTEDFDDFSNYYYAAAINGPDTHGHWREFRGTSLRDTGGSVSIEVGKLIDGLYDCILFASTSQDPKLDGDLMPLPSNALNKTKFRFKIGIIFSFDIKLEYVGHSLTTTNWDLIDDIPWYDEETGKGGYDCPASGTLYFKGKVIRTHEETSDTVNDVDFKGQSDNFNYGTWESGLHNCIFDLNGKKKSFISTPGTKNGDFEEIIIKWNGYTGDKDWDDTSPMFIGGGLSVYKETAYIGGSSDFMLYR